MLTYALIGLISVLALTRLASSRIPRRSDWGTPEMLMKHPRQCQAWYHLHPAPEADWREIVRAKIARAEKGGES